MLHLLVRCLAGCLTFLTWYLAFLTYEKEPGKIQGRIEEFWLSVYERQKQTGQGAAIVFNRIAEYLMRILDQIYGNRLISIQSFAVASDFALAAILIVRFLQFFYYLPFLVLAVLSFAVGLMPAFIKNRVVKSLVALSGVLVLLPYVVIHFPGHTSVEVSALAPLSFVFTALTIGLLRWLIRWIALSGSVLRIVMAMGLQGMAGFVSISPLLWRDELPDYGALGALEILGESNIAAAVVASAFVLCLLAVLLDRIVWPIIARLVYPFVQFKIVKNRKLMATVGLICFSVAFPKLASWSGPLEKLFSKLLSL
jgi:hypothetical protein